MTRAQKLLWWFFRYGLWRGASWKYVPRLAYCRMCGMWCLCTLEPAPYSTATGFLCEECAEDNQRDVDAAWADYYSGLL